MQTAQHILQTCHLYSPLKQREREREREIVEIILVFLKYFCYLFLTGDYRESNIVVWDTVMYLVMATSMAAAPIHCLKWDPFTVNEFISVGEQGTVLFWLLEETVAEVCLNVHEADLPDELDYGGSEVGALLVSFFRFTYI